MEQYSLNNNCILNPLDADLEFFYSSNNQKNRTWRKLENGVIISILLAAPNCAFSSEKINNSQDNDFLELTVQSAYSLDTTQNDFLLSGDYGCVRLLSPRNIEERFDSTPITLLDSSLHSLKKSYMHNVVSKYNDFNIDSFDSFFKSVSKLPFNDNIVQYDSCEKTLDVTLWFNENLRLIINKIIDECNDNVIFSIYHDNKLLVCDEMSVDELVQKIKHTLE